MGISHVFPFLFLPVSSLCLFQGVASNVRACVRAFFPSAREEREREREGRSLHPVDTHLRASREHLIRELIHVNFDLIGTF